MMKGLKCRYVDIFLVIWFMMVDISSSRRSSRRTRVAYLFAGSARSFIIAPVRISIKKNLIQSFCPSHVNCDYDIFMYVSPVDNIPDGFNASGAFAKHRDNSLGEIMASIDYMKAKPTGTGTSSSTSQVIYQIYHIGGEDEKKAMLEYSTDIRHRIYRELDSRRYSMYFSRFKAYDMMRKHEQILGQQYDWVVHARFDAAWGSPITPFFTYQPGKIYTPNTWMTEVPDTFAIMSRNLSHIFFDIESFMHPYSFCLGGPNFNSSILTAHELRRLQYNSTEITAIMKEDCRVKFPDMSIVPNQETNISWSLAGISEYILSRALERQGYEMYRGGLELRPYYMFIVRQAYEPVCFYLGTNYIQGLATNRANPMTTPMFHSCVILEHQLKKYPLTTTNASSCRPLYDNTDYGSIKISSTTDSCIFREEVSDINFMPFRIRSKSSYGCLTPTYRPNTNYHLNLSTCLNYRRYKLSYNPNPNLVLKYLPEQVFYFYPLLSTSQKIIQHTEATNNEYCLTAKPPVRQAAGQYSDWMEVLMLPCDDFSDSTYPSNQMFSVDLVPDIASMYKKLSRSTSPTRLSNNTNNLRPVTSAVIKWLHPLSRAVNVDVWYCLVMDDSSSNSIVAKSPIMQNHSVIRSLMNIAAVYLKRCDKIKFRMLSQPMDAILLLERTRVFGNPYRSGLSSI
jgi:hypothetical protein